jgi:hypothetical protein
MEYKIDVKEYSSQNGVSLIWEEGFEIESSVNGKEITIIANKSGLISLARHLLTLAQDNVPAGSHFHLDQFNSLEEGSTGMIIVRK